MISSDFRWSHLASGFFGAGTVFHAYQQRVKEFDIDYLNNSFNLVLRINQLFSELVSRPSWEKKVLKISTYGVLAIHIGVITTLWNESVDPAAHIGLEKRRVQIWKYTSRLLAVTHVALVILSAQKNRTRAVAYVVTLGVMTLQSYRKLPTTVAKTWTYTPWVAHAFFLYDGSSSERGASCVGLAIMLYRNAVSLSE